MGASIPPLPPRNREVRMGYVPPTPPVPTAEYETRAILSASYVAPTMLTAVNEDRDDEFCGECGGEYPCHDCSSTTFAPTMVSLLIVATGVVLMYYFLG